MDFENEAAFRLLANREKLNLFLGAGFSVLAQNRDDLPLALGSELNDYLINHFELNDFKSLSLDKVASHLKRTRKGDFYYLIKNLYTVKKFDKRYQILTELPVENIFTTNVDDLCEAIYNPHDNHENFLNDVEIYGYTESPGVSLFKLHGSVTYTNDKEMLFSSSELSGAFLTDASLWNMVALKIASHPTLFWGINLDSANIIDLLKPETIKNRPSQPRWLVILPGKKFDLAAKEYSAQGFRIIRATTDEMLSYLMNNWQKEKPKLHDHENFKLLFPYNYIPAILARKHPVRPISHYYQGADPSWSDVINNNIVKISLYDKILEGILNKGSTLIIGSPGCGKTTILMQLAMSEEIDGVKLFFPDMQPTQAKFLAEKISKESHVTIFLDNLSESVEAYNILSEFANITFVTTDRDLQFETIKHLVKIPRNRIIEVADLPLEDIQKICDNMNKPRQHFPEGKISLFELSYQLWSGGPLQQKIKILIKQIEEIDLDLLEFYTLLTYVRYCRVYASMDMLIYYYSGIPAITYRTIYNWVDKIYTMIDDNGYPDDSLQDFFSLRSVIFSQVSLRYIPSDTLKKVIEKFHRKINGGIIRRYDLFKKKAYDADIVKRAFPIVEQGISFYNFIIRTDNTPFIKHQFALYLWRKGQLEEAWKQIDKAYTQTSGNVFSINNTHAFILFVNNIDKIPDSEGILMQTLHHTFEVLESCLRLDMRKNYHVMTYANNALRYFKKFKNPQGMEYLKRARLYLEEELNPKNYIPADIAGKLRIIKKKIDRLISEYKE